MRDTLVLYRDTYMIQYNLQLLTKDNKLESTRCAGTV